MAATAISGFLDKYVLGHDRAAMLDTHLPRTAAAEGLITELAQLGDSTSPTSVTYRDWIRGHFTTLHDETTGLQAQLGELQAQAGALSDAALIDQIPTPPAS